MYNKEAMRKLLEDYGKWFNETQFAGGKGDRVKGYFVKCDYVSLANEYLTTRLAALDDGDDPNLSPEQIGKLNAAVDDGQEGKGLFRSGKFTLHSGQESDFKIDCDALTDEDLEALAFQIWQHRAFGEVYGVPKGGERIAEKLRRYIIEDSSVLLIVDDVMTTGNSMNEAYEKFKTKYDHIDGAVIFNRGANLPWVYSVFTTSSLPVADGEGEKVGNVKDLPEIKALDAAINNSVIIDPSTMSREIQVLFWNIIDPINRLLPSAVTGGVNGFVWTDEIVEEFARQYRVSSSRISIEAFKEGRCFPYQSQPAQGGKPFMEGKDETKKQAP